MPYRLIEDPAKLRRVLEATLLIQSNLELPEVLRHVVEEACAMTGAHYGALGVLDEDKTSLSEFITVGLTSERRLRSVRSRRAEECSVSSSRTLRPF